MSMELTNKSHSLLAKVFALDGSIEIALAMRGIGKWCNAIYVEDPKAEDLRVYSRFRHCVGFVPGVNKAMLIQKGAWVPTPNISAELLEASPMTRKLYRWSEDSFIEQRWIVSFDLDGKDQIAGFMNLSPERKKELMIELWKSVRGKFQSVQMTPTLWVYSGNGLHFHYILPTAVDCRDKRRYMEGYKAVLRFLEDRVFDGKYKLDSKCARVSQPIRLPGSRNFKNPWCPLQTDVLEVNEDFSACAFHELFSAGEDATTPAVCEPPVFPPGGSHKQRVKNALTFESVLKECGYQKFRSIKKANNHGEMLCSSPFGPSDSTASCKFNNNKKMFYDWSTGISGDIFLFLAKLINRNCTTHFREVMAVAEGITGIREERLRIQVTSSRVKLPITHLS